MTLTDSKIFFPGYTKKSRIEGLNSNKWSELKSNESEAERDQKRKDAHPAATKPPAFCNEPSTIRFLLKYQSEDLTVVNYTVIEETALERAYSQRESRRHGGRRQISLWLESKDVPVKSGWTDNNADTLHLVPPIKPAVESFLQRHMCLSLYISDPSRYFLGDGSHLYKGYFYQILNVLYERAWLLIIKPCLYLMMS